MPAEAISTVNAKQDKLFYFVANVVIFRESDGRCLILKRSEREKVHPNKYAVPGGKLEWNDLDIKNPTRLNGDVLDFEDAVEKLLMREVKEESGVEIHPELKYINSVAFIRPDGIPVVLLKLAAKYKSGDVKMEENSFTDFKWVNADEIKQFECIKGIQEEVSKTIELFSNKGSLNSHQQDVDNAMKSMGWDYWASEFMSLRLAEETGEVARVVNHIYGPKKKKTDETKQELSSELADVIYTVVCIANNNNINLQQAWDNMMNTKIKGRDLHRYDKPA